jgi:hypothetical protein
VYILAKRFASTNKLYLMASLSLQKQSGLFEKKKNKKKTTSASAPLPLPGK